MFRPISPAHIKPLRDSGSPINPTNRLFPNGNSPAISPRISPMQNERIQTPRAFRPSPVYSEKQLSITPTMNCKLSPNLTSPMYRLADDGYFQSQFVQKGQRADQIPQNNGFQTSPQFNQSNESQTIIFDNGKFDYSQNQANDQIFSSNVVLNGTNDVVSDNTCSLNITKSCLKMQPDFNYNAPLKPTPLFVSESPVPMETNNNSNQNDPKEESIVSSYQRLNIKSALRNNNCIQSKPSPHFDSFHANDNENMVHCTNQQGECRQSKFVLYPDDDEDDDDNDDEDGNSNSAFHTIFGRRRSSLPVFSTPRDQGQSTNDPKRFGTPDLCNVLMATYSVLSQNDKATLTKKEYANTNKCNSESFSNGVAAFSSLSSEKIDYFAVPSPSQSESSMNSSDELDSFLPDPNKRRQVSNAQEKPPKIVNTLITETSNCQMTDWSANTLQADGPEYCIMNNWSQMTKTSLLSKTEEPVLCEDPHFQIKQKSMKGLQTGKEVHQTTYLPECTVNDFEISTSSCKLIENNSDAVKHRLSLPVNINGTPKKLTKEKNIRSHSLCSPRENESLVYFGERCCHLSQANELKPILNDSGECMSPRSAVFPGKCSPSLMSPKNSLSNIFSPRVLSPSNNSNPSSPTFENSTDKDSKGNFVKLLDFEELVESLQTKPVSRHLSAIESEDEYSDHSNMSSKSVTSQIQEDAADIEKFFTPQESPRLPRKRYAFDTLGGSLSNSSSMSNLQDIPEIPVIFVDECDEIAFADESSCGSFQEEALDLLHIPSSSCSSGCTSPDLISQNESYSENHSDESFISESDEHNESLATNSRRSSLTDSTITLEFPLNSSRRSSFLQEGFSRVTTPCLFDDKDLFRSVSASPFGSQLKYFQERFKNHMFMLKTATQRLGLQTRRQSYSEWRRKNLDEKGKPKMKKLDEIRVMEQPEKDEMPSVSVCSPHDPVTSKRLDQIKECLDWLKDELSEMRDQDNSLAMQFLQIRKTMHEFKLEWSCVQHREMLEDAQIEFSEAKTLKRVCDLPEFHVDEGRFMYKHLTSKSIVKRKFSMI